MSEVSVVQNISSVDRRHHFRDFSFRRSFSKVHKADRSSFPFFAPPLASFLSPYLQNGGINEIDSRVEDVNELLEVEWQSREDVVQGLTLIGYVQQSLDLVKKKADEKKKAEQADKLQQEADEAAKKGEGQGGEGEGGGAEIGEAQPGEAPQVEDDNMHAQRAEEEAEEEQESLFMNKLVKSLDETRCEEMLEEIEECLSEPLRSMYWKVRDAGKAEATKVATAFTTHLKSKQPVKALECLLKDKKGGRALDRLSAGGVRMVVKKLFSMPELIVGTDLAKDSLPTKARTKVDKLLGLDVGQRAGFASFYDGLEDIEEAWMSAKKEKNEPKCAATFFECAMQTANGKEVSSCRLRQTRRHSLYHALFHIMHPMLQVYKYNLRLAYIFLHFASQRWIKWADEKDWYSHYVTCLSRRWARFYLAFQTDSMAHCGVYSEVLPCHP